MTRRARYAWAAAWVVANFLAFPHQAGDLVVDFGLVFGFLAPALLIVSLRGLGPMAAARQGFVAGLAAQALLLHWLYIVTVVYGHAAPPLGLVGPLGLGAYSALFTAAFAASFAWLAARGLGSPLAIALLWTLSDHLRTFVFTGFPWGLIGYSQHANGALLALTPWTGVYGMTFACALGGAILAGVAEALIARRRPTLGLLAAGLALLALLAAGPLLARPAPDATSSVRVAVLQGNIEQGVKWSPEWVDRTLEIYEVLSRRAAADGAEVIVYPETAVPGPLNADAALRLRFATLARETDAAFVLGAVAVERAPGAAQREFFDSAFIVQRNGRFSDRYDKSHLVPWGEYIPFGELLGSFLKAVAQGIALHGVTPGDAPRSVSLLGSPEAVSVGVPICYELLFPDLVRRFVSDGSGLLLAITNDAWYGRTGAPHQFLAMTAVRSAENGVWTARAANTGVSAIIDDRGRVLFQTRIFERDLLVADVPLRPDPVGGTFYTRHGDVFVHACWLGAAGLGLAGGVRSRRARAGTAVEAA